MKSGLLLLAAAMGVANISAQTPGAASLTVGGGAQKIEPTQIGTPRVVDAKPLGNKHILQVVTDATGYTYKRVVKTDNPNVPIKTMSTASRVKANAAAESINETFEGYNGTKTWQPAGWSVESKVKATAQPWVVTEPYSTLKGFGGDYAEMCDLSEKAVDEWLYTTPVKVKKGDSLQFLAWFDKLFAVDFSYLDMETFEFSEWHPSQVLKIWAKEDGGEWICLKDFFEGVEGKTFDELYDLYTGAFERHIIDLSQFADKTITIGFQYVGKDGNGCGIDNVSIGVPEYIAEYEFPASTMFYGAAKDLSLLGLTVPIVPVCAPVTFSNTTKVMEGTEPTFKWAYYNGDGAETIVNSTDLVARFSPNYSSELTTRNNFIDSPILSASAPGWSEGQYSIFGAFQAGGKAEFPDGTGKYKHFGMSVGDPSTESYTYPIVYGSGSTTIPYFGYSSQTQALWTSAFFGESAKASQYAKIVAVFNYIDAPATPMVINGCWTHAVVQNMKADAELTVTICPLTDEGYIMSPIATATTKAAEVGKEGSLGDYKCITFTFDQPVVMSADVCQRYIIRLAGFEGSADFFAPLQTYYGAYNGVNHGFVEFEVCDGLQKSVTTYDCEYFCNYSQSFGFNLDAYYPWLDGEKEAVVSAGSTVTVDLDSYYDASELSVATSNSKITATVSGKYNNCKATINNAGGDDITGSVTISAPGVSHTINVVGPAGVEAIEATSKTVADTYDMHGRRMAGENLPAGIYVRRYTDGSAAKVIIR